MCIVFTFTTSAQTPDKKWNVGLHGGFTQYNGDLGRDWYETTNTGYAFGGISVSRYLGKLFDANLLISKGTIGYNNGTTPGFKSDFNAASINLRFNIVAPEYVIRPYVFAGVGAVLFDSQLNFHQEKYDYILPTAGAGINFRLSPDIMLNLQETFMFSNKDRRDGVDNGVEDFKSKDSYLTHTAGITVNLGNSIDTDNDGVSDKKDNCPDTPSGVLVDKMGCPLDRDADGVADYIDNCPDVAGSKTLNGCPDKDNDGVEDSKDRCPDQAGTVMLKGCPDADKDGVGDVCDNCKTTTNVNQFDSDHDHIGNVCDNCPTRSNTNQADADKDGLGDKCDVSCGANNEKVRLCHKGNEICVSQSGAQSHLNHGDRLGPCRNNDDEDDDDDDDDHNNDEDDDEDDEDDEEDEDDRPITSSNGTNTDLSKNSLILPKDFKLSSYPNPFAGNSTIRYELPFDSKVSIKVYDVMGRVVATLVDAERKAGIHTVAFNAGGVSKGFLYYKIVAQSKDKRFEQTNKMIHIQ